MINELKERMMKKQEELTNIGRKIGAIYAVIGQTTDLIEQEELEEFWNYLVNEYATLPLADPSYYRNGGRAEIDAAIERVRILRKLKEGKWRAE
jgi:hypothetical protein